MRTGLIVAEKSTTSVSLTPRTAPFHRLLAPEPIKSAHPHKQGGGIRLQPDPGNLDMRLLPSGFADRLQFEAGKTVSGWQDLLWSRLMEFVAPARESREERLQR